MFGQLVGARTPVSTHYHTISAAYQKRVTIIAQALGTREYLTALRFILLDKTLQLTYVCSTYQYSDKNY